MSRLPIYKADYFICRIPSSQLHVLLKEKHALGTNFNITPAIMMHYNTFSGTFLPKGRFKLTMKSLFV